MRLMVPILIAAGAIQALGSAVCPACPYAVSTGSRACSCGASSREGPQRSGCCNRMSRVRATRQRNTGSSCCSHAGPTRTRNLHRAKTPGAKAEAALHSPGSRFGCRCRLVAAPAAVPSDSKQSLTRTTVPVNASARVPRLWEYLSASLRAKPPPRGPDVPRIDRSIRTTVLLL